MRRKLALRIRAGAGRMEMHGVELIYHFWKAVGSHRTGKTRQISRLRIVPAVLSVCLLPSPTAGLWRKVRFSKMMANVSFI